MASASKKEGGSSKPKSKNDDDASDTSTTITLSLMVLLLLSAAGGYYTLSRAEGGEAKKDYESDYQSDESEEEYGEESEEESEYDEVIEERVQEVVDAVSNALTFNLPYKSETLGENSTEADCGLMCTDKCAAHVFYTHSKTCNLFEKQAHSGEVGDYKGYDVHRKLGCPGESGGRTTSNTTLSQCAEKCNDWRDCVSFAHNKNNACYLSSKCRASSSTIKEVQNQDLFVKRNENTAKENIPTHGPKHLILGNSKNQWCIGLINTDSTLAFTRRTKDTSKNLYIYQTSLVLQENGTVLTGSDLASNNNADVDYNAWEAAYDWEEHKDTSLCFGYCSLHFVGSQTRRISVDSRTNRVPVGKILFTLFADDKEFIITHSNGRVLFYLRADGRFQQMNKKHGLIGSFKNNPTMPEVPGEGRSLSFLLRRGGAKWGAVGLYDTDDHYVDWSTSSGQTNIGLPESGTLSHGRPGHCINYDFKPEARGGRCDWFCRYIPFHSEADGQQCWRHECADCDACLPGRAPSKLNVPDNYSGEGKCWNLNSRVGWNDKTASMTLRPGVRVDFYEHANKTGTKIFLENETANTAYIPSSWLRGKGVPRKMTSIAVQVRKTKRYVEIKRSFLKLGNRFKIQSKEDGSLIFGFLKKDESRTDPWRRTGGRICPAFLSDRVHTGNIQCNSSEFPDSPATYPNKEYKCFIRVNGTCRHTIPLRYWFDDSSLGGPKATSERACVERRDSFKHFCGNGNVEHKFVFPGSNSYNPADTFKGSLHHGMEIALWCETHERFVRMYRGEMNLGPHRATPSLPSSWQSERFTLVQSENGKEFALYSKTNRRYVRMPRRLGRMDSTNPMNMHFPAIPNALGWERFEFVSLKDGKYAVKCPRSAGGFAFMRARSDGYVDAAPHLGSWECFHLVLLTPPITPFQYVGGASCTNNVAEVQNYCTGTCEAIAQQGNNCWHKLKIISEEEATRVRASRSYGYFTIKVKTPYGAFLTVQ